MVWARRDPAAMLLGDGRVLVLGDKGGKYEAVPEVSRFSELWDPATGTWSETDYLPTARGSFAAVPLQDGRALVTGGVNDTWFSYSSAYVFDPATERWTKVGLMNTARADPAAAVLADGRVLVAGGMYYTGLKEFGAGDAILAGGLRLADLWPGPDGRALATAELFDPTRGTWSSTGPMRFARAGGSAVTLANGRVLVSGGGWGADVNARAASAIEIYDPSTERFSLAESLPAVDPSVLDPLGLPGSIQCDQAKLSDAGRLLPLEEGGAVIVDSHWSCAASDPFYEASMTRTFRFDADTGRWIESAVPGVLAWREADGVSDHADWGSSPHPDGVIVPLPDGTLLFAGGLGTGDSGSRTATLLDPTTGSWSPLPDMPGARARAAGVVLADGSALIVGGYSNPGDGYPIALGDAFRFVPGS